MKKNFQINSCLLFYHKYKKKKKYVKNFKNVKFFFLLETPY